jgi:hypothetical protein
MKVRIPGHAYNQKIAYIASRTLLSARGIVLTVRSAREGSVSSILVGRHLFLLEPIAD